MKKSLAQMTDDEIKIAVAKRYGEVAANPDCRFNFPVGREFAESVGYSPGILNKLPRSMWESFTGAGNPQPYIDIVSGDAVLDPGCGTGLNLYLYAWKAGSNGKVYGLDISEEMIDKARHNMEALNVKNVEFFCSPADNMPLPDNSVDIVTANGIFNLSPDKIAVMREIARVLRSGCRTIFAEIVLKAPLPEEIRNDINDWFRCIGGALPKSDFLKCLKSAGLNNPEILWSGRSARCGHDLALCAVIRAEKINENHEIK